MPRMFSRPHTVIGTCRLIDKEDLFKLLGEKHQLYEFLDTFYMQCSYILFNKEHVKAILSEIVKHKAAENEQRIQSYMNMLVVVESPVDSALFPDRAPLSVLQKCEEFSSCCPVI
ncbi:Sister chromatid cohesion protein isogeny B [Arachis hypogaea]|nr:Sister chromatid cohesion protein isogeny B [Arachis hypogaea]